MDSSQYPMPSRPTWAAGRPSRTAAGPPGLAALIDGERSALREHHDRLRALDESQREAAIRATDVEAALDRQRKAQHGSPGMRDRLRTTEQQARLLVADVRTAASQAGSAVEAARYRVRASQQRLDEIRGLIDGLGVRDPVLLESIRRPSTLPASTTSFASIAEFITADPARATGDRRIEDLVGRPLGDRWALEDPDHPWLTTRWRAAWSCDGEQPLGEIYAVELVMRAHPVRRVLLFGAAPSVPGTAHVIEAAMARQGERNSLAALAAAAAGIR